MKEPSRPSCTIIKGLVLALFLSAPSFAQVTLVSDSFANVSVSGASGQQIATSGANTYYQLASTWSYQEAAANSGALTFKNAWSTGYIRFQPVTLTNVGDYLTLSFKLAYPTGSSDIASGLRYSLYNTFGNINTALGYDASSNPVGDSATGYYMSINPGTTSVNNASLSKDLGNQQVLGAGSSAVNSNSAASAIGLASFTHTSAFSATQQTITMTFTKTEAGVSISMNLGGDLSIYNDINSPYTTFDTFFFGSGNLATPFTLGDLAITTNVIPEPTSSAVILGFTALAGSLVLARSRRARVPR